MGAVVYSGVNEALQAAERRARPRLLGGHADAPNAALLPRLTSPDSQIIVGREGTGKTYLLLSLAKHLESSGMACAFVDLQAVGTADDIHGATAAASDLSLRAARLAVDSLAAIHDALRIVFLDSETLDDVSAGYLEDLARALIDVRVAGDEERAERVDSEISRDRGFDASLDLNTTSLIGASLRSRREAGERFTSSSLIVRKGPADVWLHLNSVRQAIEGLSRHRGGFAVILDEWDSVPSPLQPWLADLIRRLLWDTPGCTVKIASAREPSFRRTLPDGRLGLKPPPEAKIDLDTELPTSTDDSDEHYLVGVLHEHVMRAMPRVKEPEDAGADPEAFARIAFAEAEAKATLVDAAEDNPRDALIIADRAAQRAGDVPISRSDLVHAAHWLAVASKLPNVSPSPKLERWLTDAVLGHSGSRCFLAPLAGQALPAALAEMFDNRLIHLDSITASGLGIDPQENFTQVHIDFGYALQLLRVHTPEIDEIDVPRAVLMSALQDAPRYDESEIERLGQESKHLEVPPNAAGLPGPWVRAALKALPAHGDFLVFVTGGAVKTVELTESPTVVGRSPRKAHLHIDDDRASGRHAELVRGPANWRLFDCDSTNGTKVNSRDVRVVDLHSEDVIGIGVTQFLYISR